MKRLLILGEGHTEEAFIKSVLSPHLLSFNVAAIPKLITTKRIPDGPNFKGGVSSFGKIANDLRLLLRDTNAACVTTMIDFYGLPTDSRPPIIAANLSCYDKVKLYEQEIAAKINHPKFLPFLLLHEFEALLFTEPSTLAELFPENDQTEALQTISSKFATPEEINDSPITSPSKRIQSLLPNYRKRGDGVRAAQRIGLEKMRAACPHFNEWLTKLEQL